MANHALKNRDNGLWCKPPRHLPTLVRVTYLDVTGVITSRRLSSKVCYRFLTKTRFL